MIASLPSNVRELGLTRLLYLSRRVVSPGDEMGAVDQIVEVSAKRNASLRVTGALTYTGLHFAQVLEGPDQSVNELMASIQRDRRHRDVTVVVRQKAAARRFAGWAMACADPSPYLDRQMKRLLSPSTSAVERADQAEDVIAAMQRLICADVPSRCKAEG